VRSAHWTCRIDRRRARQETQDTIPFDVWPRQKSRPIDECRARGRAREPLIDEEIKAPSAIGELSRQPPAGGESAIGVGTQLGWAELQDRILKLSERRRYRSRSRRKALRAAHPYA
jgi:hypothetical protein